MEVDKILILEDSDKKKDVPKVNDFNLICRICLKEFEEGKSLEETEREIKIKSLIESYTPINIPESNDNFPQKICKDCIDFLIQIHIFRSRCLLNDNLLNRIWTESTKPETESNEIDGDTFYVLNSSNSRRPSVQHLIQKINDELLGIFRCNSCPEVYHTRKELNQHLLKVKHSTTPTCPCPYCGKKFNRKTLEIHIRTHMKDKSFVCKECGTSFTLRNNLNRHMRLHQDKKPFACKECDASFPIKDYLQKHIQSRHKEKFCCKLCDKKYIFSRSLAAHFFKVHKDEQIDLKEEDSDNLSCFICERSFENAEDLNSHIKTHDKTNLCSICGKVIFGYTAYSKHMKETHLDGKHKCATCNKLFWSATVFKKHQLTHGEDLICFICEKSFKNDNDLSTHIKTHDERNLCNVCGKVIIGYSEFAQHMKSHSGVKHTCTTCNKSFWSESNLRKHQLTHGNQKSVECEVCHKLFKNIYTLKSHAVIHDDKVNFPCVICGKDFKKKTLLHLHMRIHTGVKKYKCLVCYRRFTQQTHLIYHMRTHTGEKPHTCEHCGRTFSIKCNYIKHLRLHTGERPFKCSVCQKGFIDSSSLKRHEKTVHGKSKVSVQDQESSNGQSDSDDVENDEELDENIKSEASLSS